MECGWDGYPPPPRQPPPAWNGFTDNINSTSLTGIQRPLIGGVQIARRINSDDNYLCTIGFISYRGISRGLVTASHCTTSTGGVGYDDFYQALVYKPQYIGLETIDPSYTPCVGSDGLFRKCRASDAAWIMIGNDAIQARLGQIARPSAFGRTSNGATDIVGRFYVTAEFGTPFEGQLIDKVGISTGWTYGYIMYPCMDFAGAATRKELCQIWSDYRSLGGDSGGPVFYWSGATNYYVSLVGTHVGRSSDGSFAISSPINGIRQDLGPMSTY